MAGRGFGAAAELYHAAALIVDRVRVAGKLDRAPAAVPPPTPQPRPRGPTTCCCLQCAAVRAACRVGAAEARATWCCA